MITPSFALRPLRTLLLSAGAFSVCLHLQAAGQELHPSTPQNTPVTDASLKNPAVEDITDKVSSEGKNPATVYAGRPSVWDDLFSGRSPFYFSLTAGETYDDNIFIAPKKTSDFLTHVTPLVGFVQGDKTAANINYFNVVFRPTLYFYQNHSEQDRTDYFADALYQHNWTRLSLSLEQRFEELSGTDIDVGNFFKRDVYTTTLSGSYAYNDDLSLAGSETQRISNFQDTAISDTSEWITDIYANYALAPKIMLGVGPKIGFVDVAGAGNQSYQDMLLRLSYKLTEKINLSFNGGAEYRQFQDAPGRVYPIFDLNVGYTPFDGTQLSVSAYRQDVISYGDVGGNYLNTAVQANLRQRFLTNYFFLASAAYDLADYQQSSTQPLGRPSVATREDRYFFVNVGVEWDPREWSSLRVQYQYSRDDSTFAVNTFNDTQVDIQATLKF